MAKINVYVDGFNLYYRLFKNSKRKHNLKRFKWLNLRALANCMIEPEDHIADIWYCTAKVSSPQHDPDQTNRQMRYWDALREFADVKIVEGQFQIRSKRGYPVDSTKHGTQLIEIRAPEEKGTDVNLATLLLQDAFLGNCDKAIVVSNDSDLQLAIRTVVSKTKVEVCVASPDTWVTKSLKDASSNNKVILPQWVIDSQLPQNVSSGSGRLIRKPNSW